MRFVERSPMFVFANLYHMYENTALYFMASNMYPIADYNKLQIRGNGKKSHSKAESKNCSVD